jgi:hypothetical protein
VIYTEDITDEGSGYVKPEIWLLGIDRYMGGIMGGCSFPNLHK